MKLYECKLCGATVRSPTPYPQCPSGCRYPFERRNARGDYVTTEPAESPKRQDEPEQAQPQVNEEDLTGKGPCPYCGKEWRQRQLHIPRCPQGPKVPVAKKQAAAS